MAESLGNLGEAKVAIRVDWEKLDGDIDQSKKKIATAFEKSGKLMRNVGAAMTAGLTAPLVGLIGVSTKAASRVNELESVNMLLGKSAGYSEAFIKQQTDTVQGMGIEAAASREIVADFIKAELDLADASKVARVAQDAAVIAGQNSTETTKTLTQAIITGRTELFKSAGMIIDLNGAYEEYAAMTGRSADSLSEQEKIQARVNATMAYGERIAGAYAKAMEDPGKVLRSYPRYLNDVAVAFGQNFIPAFKEAIFAGKDLLSWLKDAVSEGGALEPVIQKWGELFADAAKFIRDMVERLDELDPKTVQMIADMIAFGAAMGPVLLVGGQLVKWGGTAISVVSKVGSAFGVTGAMAGAAATAIAPYVVVIAALTAGAVALAKAQKKTAEKSAETIDSNLKATDSYEEYVEQVKETAEAEGWMIDQHGNLLNQHGYMLKSNYLLTESQWKVNESMREMKYPVEMAALDAGYYADQAARAGKSTGDLAMEAEEAAEAMQAFDDALSIDSNFKSIVSMAQKYDDTLGEIADKQERVTELMAIKDSGGYLDGVYVSASEAKEEIALLNGEIDTLQQSMTEMANQMILDMYQATLAIDGFTDAEIQAYFDMAAEMGIISAEASQLAMDNYYAAKNEIEGNPVDLTMDDSKLDEVIRKFGNIPREIRTNVITNYSSTGTPPAGHGGNARNPEQRAVGGPVWSDEIYLVGEQGPELFIPNVAGSINTNNELMRGLRGDIASVRSSEIDAALLAALSRLPTAQDIARAVRDNLMLLTG